MLEDNIGPIHRWMFDKAIAAFGQGVKSLVEKAGQHNNPVIAQAQRTREWERLMGGDMCNSAAGFADPAEARSAHARTPGGELGDDEVALDGGPWW